MKSIRWWKPLAILIPLALCGWVTASLAAPRFAIPEVRAPYSTATLVESQTVWDLTGLHTIRVYHVPVAMRRAVVWYIAEDHLARYEADPYVAPVFDYGYSTSLPRRQFAVAVLRWRIAPPVLARHSDLHIIDRNDYIEVITDTRYYWRYVKPQIP